MISAFWSEWGDLNARPLEPHSSTLPSALHPDISNCSNNIAQALKKCKSFFLYRILSVSILYKSFYMK